MWGHSVANRENDVSRFACRHGVDDEPAHNLMGVVRGVRVGDERDVSAVGRPNGEVIEMVVLGYPLRISAVAARYNYLVVVLPALRGVWRAGVGISAGGVCNPRAVWRYIEMYHHTNPVRPTFFA